jgi:hypothetical protein
MYPTIALTLLGTAEVMMFVTSCVVTALYVSWPGVNDGVNSGISDAVDWMPRNCSVLSSLLRWTAIL